MNVSESMRPSEIWGGSVHKPGDDSQTGCIFCLSENVIAPLDIVYMYAGTSYCRRHVLEKIFQKAEPVESTQPTHP